MSTITASVRYQRHVRRLLKKNPQMVHLLRQTQRLLVSNMTTPSLKLHKLKGRHRVWSVSMTSDIRIIFEWDGENINLLMIGGHDDVY